MDGASTTKSYDEKAEEENKVTDRPETSKKKHHCHKRPPNQIAVSALHPPALSRGWIESACYMAKPADMIAYLLGIDAKRVDVRHETLNYKPKSNEMEITRYENRATGTTYAHFVCTKDGAVIYDPYGASSTVTNGKPVSKRIITIK